MTTGPFVRSALRIRNAEPKDAGAMARVFVESWRSAYSGLLPDKAILKMRVSRMGAFYARELRNVTSRDTHLVATRENGEIIGLAHGGPVRDRELRVLGVPVEGEIFALYIHPDAQGEGAGSALMEVMFGKFLLSGWRSAAVWMVKGNPARFFYEHLGGRKIAERRGDELGSAIALESYGWPSLVAERRPLTAP